MREEETAYAEEEVMDNQHKKITGYRDLSQDEIDAMNAIKAVAGQVENLMQRLEEVPIDLDMRWWAIGKTDLQKGFMALTRAVAQPESF